MSIKAMQQALDSLDEIRILLWKESRVFSHVHSSIDSLRIAIEDEKRRLLSTPEPKQDEEPVAWVIPGGVTESKDLAEANGNSAKPLYLHPAPRPEFVGLSEEEICIVMDNVLEGGGWSDVARAIEDALEEKNK